MGTKRQVVGQILFGALKIQRTAATVSPAVSGFIIAGGSSLSALLMLALTVFFLHLSANALNDIADYKPDVINSPDRPLVTGALTSVQMGLLAGALMIVGLLFAVLLDWLLFAITATLGLVLWASYNYGTKLKDNPAGSTVYLSMSNSVVPFLGGFIVLRNLNFSAFALAIFLAVFTSAIVIDSLKDIQGDAQTGKRTIAVALGAPQAKKVVVAMLLLPIFAYPLLWYLFSFSAAYEIYVTVPISLRLFAAFILLTQNRLSETRVLTRLLIVVDFAILALARPELGFPWLSD
jgi:geranylgeranylglycerol-phosphate geranylgeranyltransferase